MGEDVKRVYPGWMRDRALREPVLLRFSRALFPGRERNNEAKRGVRETKNEKRKVLTKLKLNFRISPCMFRVF